MKYMIICIMCSIVGGAVFADPIERVWNGPATGGALDAAENWTPAGLEPGDHLVVEATGPMTLTNGSAGLTLGGLSLTGGQSVTVTGQSIAFSAGAVVYSDGGACRTNRFECPLELASGVVTFSAESNTVGSAVFDFVGVISGAGGLATAGDCSGTYHFRGENTYGGMTYLTNALAYHLWSDGALGASGESGQGTFYKVPAGLRGTATDRLASPLYFHGIDTSEEFSVRGDQTRDFDFVAGTTNVLRGNISWGEYYYNVERWYVEENANVRILGDVKLCYVSVFNVFNGGYLKFEGPVKLDVPSGLRPAPQAGGCCEFANEVTLGNGAFQVWGEGNVIVSHPDAFGASGAKFESTWYASTVEFAGGHQTLKTLKLTKNTTVTSADGTVVEITEPGEVAPLVAFTDSVALQLDSGSVTLGRASDTSGALVVTNGAEAILSASSTWKGAGVKVCDGSTLRICASDILLKTAVVEIADEGKMILDADTSQTVSSLVIGNVQMEPDKTYGASGSDVIDTRHFGGSGVLRVMQPGILRTWIGDSGGLWSSAANWNPRGVPSKGDTLVFNASAGAITAENDLTAPILAGLVFCGDHAIEVRGNRIPLAGQSVVEASGAIPVTFKAGLDLTGPVEFNATSNALGHVVWRFDGGFSGEGAFTTAGDSSAECHFTADSPDFDGDFILMNGSAYHAYADQSFGSTKGYTRYEVVTGSMSENQNRFVAKFVFHGITTSENFYWAGFHSHSLYVPENTTNVFNGAFDVHVDARATTERWDFSAGSRTIFNGDIGMQTLSNAKKYEYVIFIGGTGAVVEMNGRIKCNTLARFQMGTGALAVLSSTVPTGCNGVSIITGGTLRLAEPNLFDFAPYYFDGLGVVDFDGHDQVFSAFVGGSTANKITDTTFSSATPATCRVTAKTGVGLTQNQKFKGALSLEIASGTTTAIGGTANTSTGVVSAVASSCAYMTSPGTWSAATVEAGSSIRLGAAALASDAVVSVAAGGRLALDQGVRQSVSALKLNGVAMSALKTYGSTASNADIKDDAYFSGTGVIWVDASLKGIARTWKGSGTSLADATAWEPAGVPKTGDRLLITADGGVRALVNDLPEDVALGELTFRNGMFEIGGSTPLRILDTESGFVAENAQVVMNCGVEAVLTGGLRVLYITADQDSSFDFVGVIGGSATLRVDGSGAVSFRGLNTFTGELCVENGTFHAYGDSPFGTSDGKTTFSAATGVACEYRFHGITTADEIDWSQPDTSFRGFFEEGTTNLLTGTIRVTSGSPRWSIGKAANVRVRGDVLNCGLFIFDSLEDSDISFEAGVYGSQLRARGKGRIHLHEFCELSGTGYRTVWGTGSVTFCFHADDIWGVPDGNALGAAVLGMDGGAVDLNGHSERTARLVGASGAIVRSAEPATLHVLQTYDDAQKLGSSFDGTFVGQVGLSVEGCSAVTTQILAGVSTTMGNLAAKDGAIVCLTETGRWTGGGEFVIRDGSEIILSRQDAIDRHSVIRIYGSGKLVLLNGVMIRCADLYVNDIKQPAALACSPSAAVPGAIPLANIGGTGVLRFGKRGGCIILR